MIESDRIVQDISMFVISNYRVVKTRQ